MNYSILLVVEKPDLSNVENEQLWKSCKTNLLTLSKQNKGFRLLGENVVLIPINNELCGLSKVLPSVCKLGYSYLILNEEISWHKVTKQV